MSSRFPKLFENLPGVLLCFGLFAGAWGFQWLLDRFVEGFQPLSSVVIAIVFGIVVANTVRPGPRFKPGIAYCVRTLLRAGIVLIGLRLSLAQVGELGAVGLPVVIGTILIGVVGIELLGRAFGLPERLSMLLAAGTSICGITAVVSTAPVIRAEERDVAYAVANVTVFGLVATLSYPYLVPKILELGVPAGLFLGTAIHDTSQMMGAAATYRELYGDELGFATATVTKMTRNLFLALVIPYFAWRGRRLSLSDPNGVEEGKRPPLIPIFLLGFLGMSAVRTVGDLSQAVTGAAFGFLPPGLYEFGLDFLGKTVGSTWLIGVALVGVGLGLRWDTFKGLGLRPFLLGFIGAGLLGVTATLLIRFFAS